MGICSSIHFHTEEKKLEQTTEFVRAASVGDIETVLHLLAHGQFVDCVDRFGLTALHWACFNGQLGMVKALLENGACSRLVDTNGRTPLHHACHKNREPIVVYLLEHCQADINALSGNGDSPLHKAVREGHVEMVKLLMKYRANPNLTNKDGKCPLDEALTASNMQKPIAGGGSKYSPEDDLSKNNYANTSVEKEKTDIDIAKDITAHLKKKLEHSQSEDTIGAKGPPNYRFRRAGQKVIKNIRLSIVQKKGNKYEQISEILISNGARHSFQNEFSH